jgi:hypothetical protein
LREIALTLQSLALRQIQTIERPGREDDIRCNECLQAWVRGGVERDHLEACAVGNAMRLARLLLEHQGFPADGVTFSHEERAAFVAANAYPPSLRIVEIPAEKRAELSAQLDAAFASSGSAESSESELAR